MKIRSILIIVTFFLTRWVYSQPVETVYLGTVAKSGYINDASYGPLNIGFNFTYFGNTYSQFYVTSNGLVMFGSGSVLPSEVIIPSAGVPDNFIAPFWDDLVIDPSGNILYTTIGASPNRKLIIQFRNMGFYSGPVYLGTFSVILHETSNKIQTQYRVIILPSSTLAHGASATIGIENSDGSAGVPYSYHNPAAITSGQAISYIPSGLTYTMDPDAMYDGIYLTTNLTLPEPGITNLLSPAEDAIIGSDHTFQWAASSGASSYTLKISTNPNLSGATNYNTGSNLSYDVTGLTLGATYYWGVFATNATGTTWCEIRKFTTSSTPPLAAVPQTLWVELNQEKTIKLNYTGGDASAKTAIITSLPLQGQLFQYDAGVKGVQITSALTTVTDTGRNVIYLANGTTGNGAGNFTFKIHDDTGDSPEKQITVNVSPPGIPSLLYTAKGTGVEMQFDRIMANPAGKENQFTVTVDGTPVSVTSLALKAGDPYTITAVLPTPLTGSETVTIAYTAGDVASAQGGWLASFTPQTVSLKSQTITFTISLSKKYSDSPFTLSSSATSSLGMTYSSSNLSVVTISGSVATFHAVGSSDITARQAGNGTWAPAKYIRTLTVAKGDQTIAFGVLSNKTYGDGDYAISAIASSGLIVNFNSTNTGVATVAGIIVHIVGAGTTVITASQPGNSLWNSAPDVPQTLTVNKADQTITFSVLSDKIFGDPDYSLSASASSGLSVSYLSGSPLVATITGNTVHIVGAGTTVITASQSGDANYNPAPDVPQTLTVNKADQTIAFSALSDKTFGDPDYSLTASASSGLSVSYSSGNPLVATITGNSVHIVAPGTAVITASQPGDANYNPAPDVLQTLTVNKADQTIAFSVLSDKTFGDPDYSLTASASSGLSVSYSSGNPLVATITGNSVHIVAPGTAVITASQAGDANYNPAPDVPQTLTVNKADQTIAFSALSDKTYGDEDYMISAIASSGLSVNFGSSNSGVATVAGNTVHIAGAGTTIITASQPGDAYYNPAPDVPQMLTVHKISQTIIFTDVPDSILVSDSFTLGATTTSGLTVLFESSDNNLATISGSHVTGVSKGTVQVRAYNDGDQNYEAAEAFTNIEVYSTHKNIMYLFTPNTDGINDHWELPEMPEWGNCDVKVYNRWGKLVYVNKNYNNEWNGLSNGYPLLEGAYYFVIKTKNAGVVKGTVNIVR